MTKPETGSHRGTAPPQGKLLSSLSLRHCPHKTGYLPTSLHRQQTHKLVTRHNSSEKKKMWLEESRTYHTSG